MSNKFKPGDKVRSTICDMAGTVIGPHPACHDALVILSDDYSEGYRVQSIANLELIPEPRKVEGWVNFYETGLNDVIWPSREMADGAAGCNSFKRIACIYVSGTEGVEP